MTTIKAEVTVEYLVPHLPNFIKTADGSSIPVQAISEDSLRRIGEAFTEALVEHAKNPTVSHRAME